MNGDKVIGTLGMTLYSIAVGCLVGFAKFAEPCKGAIAITSFLYGLMYTFCLFMYWDYLNE